MNLGCGKKQKGQEGVRVGGRDGQAGRKTPEAMVPLGDRGGSVGGGTEFLNGQRLDFEY